MKEKRFAQMKQQMLKDLDAEIGPKVVAKMDVEFQSLCEGSLNKPEDFQSHLHKNIFPVVAAFNALLSKGYERQKAAEVAGDAFLKLMDQPANAIRSMLKIPGLYKTMPWIWKTMMPKMFSEASGFRFKFYPTDNHRVKFDMTSCPYLDACKELNCPELAPIFCATDDKCYGNMHKYLIWNRTKTMARGNDVCDFDLEIKKPSKN